MTGPTPPISPDGAYWWDGQAWRPMPIISAPAPAAQVNPVVDRPSWLPQAAEVPPEPAADPAPAPIQAAYAPSATPAPAWEAPTPSGASRSRAILAAGLGLLLLVGVGGMYALNLRNQNSTSDSTTASRSAATPSSTLLQSPSPVAALPLTGRMGGEYCPVAHVNNNACWKGEFVNTGPPIGKLALIFVKGGGYTDWFVTHRGGTLSGFYTTAGCALDAGHSQMVCGSVASGADISVYLSGDVSKRGTYRYAVKFADISSGSAVYVDQHPDGTHEVVSWTERIT